PSRDDLPGDEDRADLVRSAQRARSDAVRERRARVEVPGTARPDAVEVLAELPAGTHALILVTGGTGFVGGHVVHALRAAGKDVRVLVRDRRSGVRLEGLGVTLVEGDMTQLASLRAAVEGCNTVVHLVAVRQGREERFQRVMVEGTRDLLAAANDTGVARFVHMSALGTSEATKDLVPYYRAKWTNEQAVAASGIPHVIFRPSFVFARDGGILPTFVRLARLAPVTPIIGS